MALKIGDKIPSFTGETENGKISNKDIIGENSVIYFYPKDSTPGCTTEACDFRDNFSKFKTAKIKVYGVSKDSLASHAKFIEKQKLPFTLISDEDTSICQAFGIWGKKKFMGREFMGIKRTTFLVDSKGIIRAIWEDVKVKAHVDDVLKAAKELL